MTDPSKPPDQPGPAPRRAEALRRAGAWLAGALEWPLSRRGLGVLFFLAAGVLVTAAWIRPPLSADLGGLDFPLQIGPAPGDSAEGLLHGPRQPRLASLGGVLLAIAAAGAAAVLWRPRLLGPAAGLLLCGTLAAGAVVVFNQPALVELLDLEVEQRRNMVSALPDPTDPPPLAAQNNGRAKASLLSGRVSAAPVRDQEWGGPFRGWAYLMFAPFLAYLAALGTLLGTAGPLRRRLAHLAAWTAAGALLAGAACWPRLRAEACWDRARLLEARGDYAAARQELNQAVGLFPQLGALQRTWLLAGKLDYRERRSTPQERFFRAYQYGRSQERAKALALLEGLRSGSLHDNPAPTGLAARIATAAGLRHLTQNQLGAAQRRCQEAAALAPQGRDARWLLGVVQARLDPSHPARVEASFGPLLGRSLADQMLRADGLDIVGKAYFEGNQVPEARKRYAQSLDAYSLPRPADYRAEKGLGGL
jgi:tetratricopeptide (TPR) repeat protein